MGNAKSIPAGAVEPQDRPGTSHLRTGVEMGVCLVILVVIFRTFLAGGYMIETGSMAPCLLGVHRQEVCPSCRYRFAVEGTSTSTRAVCPNCGRGRIVVEGLLQNDGDHLLVHRGEFDFRRPRRWEVIVFRNPNKPTQAYVKRLVALPGEAVHIQDGDVYISGEIQAKSYQTQRGLRIPVYDHDFRPPADDPEWQPRWIAESPAPGWQPSGGGFRYAPPREGAGTEIEWVHYRHWIRHGGFHATSVPLARWPESMDPPRSGFGPLRYDGDVRTLVCRGALSAELRDQLLRAVDDDDSRRAIERLYEASHIAPISDTYGYNWGREGQGRYEVRDLMLSAQVRLHDGQGEFALGITDGTEDFRCVFDIPGRKVRLIDLRTGRAMRTGALDEAIFTGPVTVEISLMDRQVLLAVGEKLVFEPWSYPAPTERGATPWRPVRFGARGVAVEVASLKLFRDVYYTDDVGRRAIDGAAQLKANEYFVLGDNSPVSKDSRSWTNATVLTSDMLLGKPLVVHLPSRKKRFQIGSWQTEIRIPEISRIRYIH
jgi:signal peptidase I